MAVTLTTRGPDGQLIETAYAGDVSPEGTPADVPATDTPGAPTAPPAGEPPPSAPPAEPPAPGEGESPGDGDDEPEPEVATVDYVARRIKRLTARQRAQEREFQSREQAWTQERAQLQGQLQVMTQLLQESAPDLPSATPQDPTQPPPRPNAADYQDGEQDRYDRDMTAWVTQNTQYEIRQDRMREQASRTLQEREAAFVAQHADYHDVVRTQLAGKVAPHVQQALMLLPEGPALAYALATEVRTPGQTLLIERLNQLPPPLMLMELGRLVPTASPAVPPPPPATAPPVQTPPPLPPPLQPVVGRGAPPPESPAEWSQEEFRTRWNAGWRPKPTDFGR